MNLYRAKKIGASLLLFFSLTAAVSPAAFAAVGDPAQQSIDSIQGAANSATDPNASGMGMLRQVFGNIVDNPLSPTDQGGGNKNVPSPTILGNVFGVLNMSILAIGSIFLTYNIAAGVAQTAQDGEFLGKRFSTLWIPVRLVGGVVTLVPVFHGWAMAQLIILYFSVLGVGIGNLATTEVSSWMAAGNSIIVKVTPPSSLGLVTEVYKMNLCMSGMSVGTTPPAYTRSTAPVVYGDHTSSGDTYFYGLKGAEGTCGVISVPRPSDYAGRGRAYVQSAAAAYQAIDQLAKAKTDAFVKSMVDASTDGNAVVTYTYSAGDIAELAKIYQGKLNNAPPTLDAQAAIQNLSSQGFIGLGAYYSALAKSGSNLGDAVASQASVKKAAPDANTLPNLNVEYYSRGLLVMAGKAQVDGGESVSAATKDGNAVVTKAVDAINAEIGGGCAFSGFARLLNCTYSADQPILISMKNTGDVIAGIGIVGVTSALFAKGTIDGASKGWASELITGSNPITGGLKGGFASVGTGFAGMLVSLFQTFMFFGMMLATYLPLLPYIAWLGAVISWLTVVIEGVVAAPLWAFAHLDTDGEGMGQKAQHGYGFIMHVLFRPVLMVIGFLMAAIVMEVVGRFFFLTYPMAVSDAATINGWTSILGFLVATAVFFTTSVMIINTCVNLIHLVPDSVLAWIAPNTASQGAGKEMSGHFGAAAGGVSAYGGGMAKQSMAGAKARMLRGQGKGLEAAMAELGGGAAEAEEAGTLER